MLTAPSWANRPHNNLRIASCCGERPASLPRTSGSSTHSAPLTWIGLQQMLWQCRWTTLFGCARPSRSQTLCHCRGWLCRLMLMCHCQGWLRQRLPGLDADPRRKPRAHTCPLLCLKHCPHTCSSALQRHAQSHGAHEHLLMHTLCNHIALKWAPYRYQEKALHRAMVHTSMC